MTLGFHLGLRARLAIALIGIAVLTVDLSMLFSTIGLNGRVAAAARERLTGQALHIADAAAGVYSSAGAKWTGVALSTLGHVAAAGGIRIQLVDTAGKPMGTADPRLAAGVPHASAEVMVNGHVVGHLTITPLNGQLLTPEEIHLKHSLDVLHLYAGVASGVVALCLAFFLAGTLSAPLRRIRAGAERLSRGELATRVALGGDDEIRAVGLALNRLAETLQQEEALRKESVADLAHELRTPVTGILSRIEAAQDGVMVDAVANLDAMHDEATRLVRLLDDLRNLTDAERPGLLVEKRPLDLAVLAARQVELAGPAFAEKGVGLRGDLVRAFVDGDAARLAQVVANLLSNALRYTPSSGSVTVVVGTSDGSALLEVADTGIGIAAEDLPHIFTRFWRGDRSRSRETGGAGIGLAIVSELVLAHDGTVAVESVLGKGSRFVVRLPLCSRQTPEAEAPVAAEGRNRARASRPEE
jgi:two-component system sensor histidine kinase BaeS